MDDLMLKGVVAEAQAMSSEQRLLVVGAYDGAGVATTMVTTVVPLIEIQRGSLEQLTRDYIKPALAEIQHNARKVVERPDNNPDHPRFPSRRPAGW